MAYCPNPGCTHRQLTGNPAEFKKDVIRCTECGTMLVEDDPTTHETEVPCPAPLKRRLLLTLAAVLLIWLGFLVPPLHVDSQALEEVLGQSGRSASALAGPFALGINPFISAFVLVELYALGMARLRRRRSDDPRLRSKLYRASFVLGVVLGLLQGLGIAMYLEGLRWPHGLYGPEVVPYPGWAFRLKMMFTLTAGSCLLGGVAMFVSRHGVGSGFAVVILAFWAMGLSESGATAWYWLEADMVAPLQLAVGMVLLGGIYAGIWWFLRRSDRLGRQPGSLPIRLPTCGILPIELTASFLLLASHLNNLLNLPWLNDVIERLTPGSDQYLVIQVAMVAILVPLASKWFYWRRRKDFARRESRSKWYRAQLHSGLFLLALVLAWFGLFKLAPELEWLFPASLVAVPAVAMGIDLWHEIQARWHAPGGRDLVALSMFQDVSDSLEAHRAMPKETGAYLQGIHFRSLSYLFGPFIPLAILAVSRESKDT